MSKKRKSLDDIVYEKLKEAIVLRKLPPSYKIVESEIAEILKVSRTPVRIALKMLEKDGLVVIIPNKGAFITKKTYDEIIDAFAVRIELEKMSIRLAINNLTKKDIDELKKVLEKESEAYAVNNRSEAYVIGADFHLKIAEVSGNKCLKKYIRKILIETDVYNVFYILNDPKLEKEYFSPKQHYDILEALIHKDIIKSEKYIVNHILSTERRLNLMPYDEVTNIEGLLK